VQKHEEIDKTIKKELRNETTPEKVIEFSDEDKTTLHNFQQLFENDKIYRTQNLSVVTVAEALGVNKNHLSHLINNYYQRNFSEYTNHYRVEEAKEIFKKQCNNYTMQHIAEIVGFTYRTTFNDVFKKIVGITPSEYKRVVKCMK
jgi:AraC-like DNA-binding protein